MPKCRAGRAAGWEPTARRPPVILDGELFLRLPADPTQPPPGSEDDLKRRFLSALREQILITVSPPPATEDGDGDGSGEQDPHGPDFESGGGPA